MSRMPRAMIALVLAGAAVATAARAAPLPANIAAAAADPGRAEQAARDPQRHGPDILAFAGVKPGAKVIDLIPGGGYWTRLFARAVGDNGHVYEIWPTPYAAEAGSDVTADQALAASGDYRNVSVSIEPATTLAVLEKVDLVFTSQNYHDYPDKFMGSIDPSVLNKAVYAALKPGGIFLVVDHAAAAGSGMRDTDTLHRIDPAIVKAQVVAAGFRFVGESELLRNPADDHSKLVFDKAIRGHTDQFVYKFRKPA